MSTFWERFNKAIDKYGWILRLGRLLRYVKEPERFSDLKAGEMIARAASGGVNGRALYFLRHPTLSGEVGADFDFVAGERRALVMASAQSGFAPAQVIMALNSWAERTPEGYARARRWLTAAQGRSALADKYLAALLISHPVDAEADARRALEIARAASKTLYGQYDTDLWQVLAAAHAAVGEFGAAKRAQRKARSLAALTRWPTDDIDRRLEVYKASGTVTEELVTIPVVARELRTDELLAAR